MSRDPLAVSREVLAYLKYLRRIRNACFRAKDKPIPTTIEQRGEIYPRLFIPYKNHRCRCEKVIHRKSRLIYLSLKCKPIYLTLLTKSRPSYLSLRSKPSLFRQKILCCQQVGLFVCR